MIQIRKCFKRWKKKDLIQRHVHKLEIKTKFLLLFRAVKRRMYIINLNMKLINLKWIQFEYTQNAAMIWKF